MNYPYEKVLGCGPRLGLNSPSAFCGKSGSHALRQESFCQRARKARESSRGAVTDHQTAMNNFEKRGTKGRVSERVKSPADCQDWAALDGAAHTP